MATLLQTLSSDEEDNHIPNKKEQDISEDEEEDDEYGSDADEIDAGFSFGGLMGEDGGVDASPYASSFHSNAVMDWSYKTALDLLAKNDSGSVNVERTQVANIIAAARSNLLKDRSEKESEKEGEESESKMEVDGGGKDGSDSGSDSDDTSSETGSDSDSNSDSDSDSDSSDDEEEDENVDDAEKEMDTDVVKLRTKEPTNEAPTNDDEEEASDDDNNKNKSNMNDEAEVERAKAAAFFSSNPTKKAIHNSREQSMLFSQLALSRPLLRGVSSMGYVTPTPIQQNVIPTVLAGRDVCASAVTGSGKTAAFLLPMMERILQRKTGSGSRGKGGRRGSDDDCIRGLVLTPTRELAAQCLSMMIAMTRHIHPEGLMRGCLIVGGAKNVQAQAAELRARPDIVIATPGRLIDHLTNSQGVGLEDLEFLVLDEADRLLELGFIEEITEIVKSCPPQRQTMLFSATMDTKVDDLAALSLKRPVRVSVSDKNQSHASSGKDDNAAKVEVAPRLEQEFVRVRSGNEAYREAMLLSLLTRTYKTRTICFFDTKVAAHRLMIICGLCGVKVGELHGNLTQTQRLEALESFRNEEIDVLLATDLAGRGIDIKCVDAVLNFEMPNQVSTYVHRIGRTARAGRGGRSCTLIGEGRRHLMKEVMKDAEEKNKQSSNNNNNNPQKSTGIIRSRTIPPAVISHFTAKIASLEDTIAEVLSAEAVAKMDRLAEMEAMRATNIISHQSEIKSRPRKEWFTSERAKEEAKQAQLDRHLQLQQRIEKNQTGLHRMTREKRRRREAMAEMEEYQKEMREERERLGHKPKNLADTEQKQKSSVRAAKRQAQESESQQHQSSIYDEDLSAKKKARKKEGLQKLKTKKAKGVFGSDALGDGGLFEEERILNARPPKKQKEDERAKPSAKYQFTEFDPNKKYGKGGKKSVNKFKSKSKYKRR